MIYLYPRFPFVVHVRMLLKSAFRTVLRRFELDREGEGASRSSFWSLLMLHISGIAEHFPKCFKHQPYVADLSLDS